MPNKIIVKDHKYVFKVRGLGGVKGDKGDTGPAGPQGPQGPYVNVAAGTTTTLPAGYSAQVTVNNVGNTSVLNFGIPKGDTGAKGDKGDKGNTGPQGPQGPQGNTGPAGLNATVTAGTTTTGAPGTPANVVNSGTGNQAVLDFTIPQGPKGDVGPQGPTGPQGPIGPQGPRGYTGGIKSTVVGELPETGQDDTYYLLNRSAESHTATTTDGYAQITNTENAGDLAITELDGNATQKTIAGKNLIDTNALNRTLPYSSTSHGIAFTLADDGSISLNGKNDGTGNSVFSIYNNTTPLVLVGGNYTGDLNPSDGVYRPMYLVVYDGAHYRGFAQASTQQLDASNSTAYLQVLSGETTQFSNYTIFPMLESGSTKSPYEPYVGSIDGALTPSPNPSYPQDVNVVTGLQTLKVVGKNLLTLDGKTPIGGNALSYVINNSNSITVTATASATNYSSRMIEYTLSELGLKAGDTFTLSADITGTYTGNTGSAIRVYYNDTSGSYIDRIYDTNNSTTLTIPSGTTSIWLLFYCRQGSKPDEGSTATFNNIQLEHNSAATDFKPYQSNSHEINLGGTNLLNISTVDWGYINSSGVPAGTTNPQNWLSDYIEVKPNTTYTFSLTPTVNTDTYIRLSVAYFDSTQTFISRDAQTSGSNTSRSFTTPATCKYVRISAAKTPDWTEETRAGYHPQFELGDKATQYAPYTTYAYELAKINDYQDYIYKSEGKWYIHTEIGKLMLKGSESWSEQPTYYQVKLENNARIPATSAFSNYYTFGSATREFYLVTSYARFRDIRSSLADYKIWLASHNTTVYYALATATDTEITDADLIEQLNTVASLFEGVNNLMLIPSAGAQGELAVAYTMYDKYNQHQVYIWSSDDNTWQVILP